MADAPSPRFPHQTVRSVSFPSVKLRLRIRLSDYLLPNTSLPLLDLSSARRLPQSNFEKTIYVLLLQRLLCKVEVGKLGYKVQRRRRVSENDDVAGEPDGELGRDNGVG